MHLIALYHRRDVRFELIGIFLQIQGILANMENEVALVKRDAPPATANALLIKQIEAIGGDLKDLAPVTELARRMAKIQLQIADAEAYIVRKKVELRQLETEEMPGLMRTQGVKGKLELSEGCTLELVNVFQASLPAKGTIEKANEDERPFLLQRFKEGLAWLRKRKADDIIREVVKLEFGKGKEATAAVKQVMALAKQLHIKADRTESIHPSQLTKYLKEVRAKGIDIPESTFALFIGEEAKVKLPKAKRSLPAVSTNENSTESD